MPAPFTFADAREVLMPQGNGVIPGFAEPSGDAQQRPDDFMDDCPTCGGEGFTFDCFDGQCLDCDIGCDDCTQTCPDCPATGGEA